MLREHLKRLYSLIPEFKGDCQNCDGHCCKVPFAVSDFEMNLLTGNNFYAEDGACAFMKEGKCSVYENRPLICRIYGVSELYCETIGYKPLIEKGKLLEILTEYMILFWTPKTLAKAPIFWMVLSNDIRQYIKPS